VTSQDQNYRYSTIREQMIEHLFISELMQEAWFGRKQPIEVLRSEVDLWGYDLAIECNGILRHIQLKSSVAERQRFSVSAILGTKPSGCVVWIKMGPDSTCRRAHADYFFWGGEVGKPLPKLSSFRVTKHTRANSLGKKAERPGHLAVPASRFESVSGIQELANRLFGPPREEFTF